MRITSFELYYRSKGELLERIEGIEDDIFKAKLAFRLKRKEEIGERKIQEVESYLIEEVQYIEEYIDAYYADPKVNSSKQGQE